MIAFVLCGGGNLGSIQVGMLKALLENGVVPDLVVGTSIGSVNAAMLAADPTIEHVDRLCQLWQDVRARDIFSFNPLRVAGALFRQGALFPSTSWRRFLERRLPFERIEDSAIPLRITATDFEEGTPVVFDSGSVIDAVLASTALPSIFPPHRIGDRLYLDGALSDQVPLKAAVEEGATTIYVLAVSTPSPPPNARKAGPILRHSLTILLFPRIRLNALDLGPHHEELQIVQVPSLHTQVSLWDMSRHSDLIDEAYQHTSAFLAERDDTGCHEDSTTHVAEVPEMRVEAETQEPIAEARSAGETPDDPPG